MLEKLEALIAEASLTQDEIGSVLEVTGSAVNLKLSGRRGWSLSQVNKLLALLSARLGRHVSYEEAFGAQEPVKAAR